MSWRTASAVLIVVFVLVLIQSVLAGPLMQFHTSINSSVDGEGGNFNANQVIAGLPGAWFNMGLVAIFGFMLWGIQRVVRRELTRGRGGL